MYRLIFAALFALALNSHSAQAQTNQTPTDEPGQSIADAPAQPPSLTDDTRPTSQGEPALNFPEHYTTRSTKPSKPCTGALHFKDGSQQINGKIQSRHDGARQIKDGLTKTEWADRNKTITRTDGSRISLHTREKIVTVNIKHTTVKTNRPEVTKTLPRSFSNSQIDVAKDGSKTLHHQTKIPAGAKAVKVSKDGTIYSYMDKYDAWRTLETPVRTKSYENGKNTFVIDTERVVHTTTTRTINLDDVAESPQERLDHLIDIYASRDFCLDDERDSRSSHRLIAPGAITAQPSQIFGGDGSAGGDDTPQAPGQVYSAP